MGTFDKNYYEQKKINLVKKREQLILKYSDEAFNYVSYVVDINREIQEIEAWEAQQPKVEPIKQAENAVAGSIKKIEKIK